ncbi:MAG TPA: hypothetical protein VN719_02875 [Gemmatimonadales bacterium]|nr:hypothetical protein [Gemmatimonadales bacterium]
MRLRWFPFLRIGNTTIVLSSVQEFVVEDDVVHVYYNTSAGNHGDFGSERRTFKGAEAQALRKKLEEVPDLLDEQSAEEKKGLDE